MGEAQFKAELSSRYEWEISTKIIKIVNLQQQWKIKAFFEHAESSFSKFQSGPIKVNRTSLKKVKRQLLSKYIYQRIIRPKKTFVLDEWAIIIERILRFIEGNRKDIKSTHPWWLNSSKILKSFKEEFYQCIYYVDYAIYLRFPQKHSVLFRWFFEENIVPHKKLSKYLRHGTTTEFASFERGYNRNNKKCEIIYG